MDIWQDVQFGLRTLRKNPGFTLVAVLTLALGVGANTAIFSMVNQVLLQPLPFPQAERLVFVKDVQPQFAVWVGSYPEFLDWREQDHIFETVAGYWRPSATLTGDGDPERVDSVDMTANLFPVLGLAPLMGRAITEEDDHPDAERVALLGYELWQRRYGGDPGILNSVIHVNGDPTTVIGIMPPGAGTHTPTELRRSHGNDIWRPLRLTVERSRRGSHYITVIGKLKEGVTFDQAQGQIGQVAQAFKDDGRTEHGIELAPIKERIVGSSRTSILVLMGAVALVLLIACANVANLLLARASARQRELAIRAALGAGRLRLIRQLMTENLILAGSGGLLGLLLAWWSVRIFSVSSGAAMLRTGAVDIDPMVLAFTLGLTALTGILFGVGPALHAASRDVNETLKEGGRQPGAGQQKQWFRGSLVVIEVGLSLLLLTGTGLLLRSFQNLLDSKLGFNPDNLLTFRITLPIAKYESREQVDAFFDSAFRKIAAVPGVEGVGATQAIPLEGGRNSDFDVEGLTWPEGHGPLAETRQVNPDYFRTMGIPLRYGRLLEDTDTADTQNIVVVDEEFVRRVFQDAEPLGRRIYFGGSDESTRYEIVGVVGNVQHWGVGQETRPGIYFTQKQVPRWSTLIVVRTAGNPMDAVNLVRTQISSIDPDLPLSRVRSMDEVLASNLSRRRLSTLMLTAFAVLALFLASIGLYGVISYSVSQRTHEVGIRMALGAQSPDILKLVVGQGLLLAAGGVVAGLAGAFVLTRYLRSLLYEVQAADPMTFAAVSLIVLLVAVLASYVPARRAARVDPMVALRSE